MKQRKVDLTVAQNKFVHMVSDFASRSRFCTTWILHQPKRPEALKHRTDR